MNAIQIILTALVGLGFIVSAGWVAIEIAILIEDKKRDKRMREEDEAFLKFWSDFMKEDNEPK